MILVGTSGWSHDAWLGPFYPVQLRDRPDAWLAYYGGRFRSVEVRGSFDAMPDEALVTEWSRVGLALADAGLPFEFSLKLPREVTHDALVRGDVHRAWEVAARFERQVLDPLADEGLLGAVLVQVPSRLAPARHVAQALREILSAMAGRQVALDLRHPGWALDGRLAPEARDLLASPDVCLVQSDEPGAPRASDAPRARHTYARLHGRASNGSRDHVYTGVELAPWAERLRAEGGEGRVARAYFTGSERAAAPASAIELLHLLGEARGVPKLRVTEQTKLPV